MNKGKIALVVIIAALVAAFFVFDLKQYFSLEYFKTQQAAITAYYQAHPLQTALIYFLVYIAIAALSLPGAALTTLVGGAIFGTLVGTVIVSFASCIGATLAFLSSRFLLRDWIQSKYGDRMRAINDGVAKDGAFYLFTIRMIPLIPFWLVNLAMGVTSIRTWTFYWVSQLGMLLGTIVYVNAGTQLGKVAEGGKVFTPAVIVAFTFLALLGPISKIVIDRIRAQRVYAKWKHLKPAKFDRNMVVIGAGSGGLVSSYIAAAVKSKVTLVEKHLMGGDCLNFGCVPSKALIRSAKFLSHARRAKEFGMKDARVDFDFADVMERVHRVIKAIAPHDSVERYTGLGVDVVLGEARITSPWHVEITTSGGAKQTLTTKSIVVATGAAPFVPPIPGLDQVGYVTSDTIWEIRTLPKRLVVLGGGPIGSELTQAFARLGSKVYQVEMLPRILPREDLEVSELVAKRFREEGIEVLTGHRAKEFRLEAGEKVLIAEHEGREVRIVFDLLLAAVGRVARTKGFGLEELEIGTTKTRTLEVDEYLRTKYPNITGCGDVVGPYQFTHTAAHTAYYAATNALFGGLKKSRVDYSVIPWCTFTEPEVARVGLNELEAKEKNIAYEVTKYGIDDLDRAIADEEAHGFVKVLTVPGKDRILGVTVVGEHAGDLIAEYVYAMRHRMGLSKIMSTIHIYPTLAEANKFAAGEWRKAHQPERILGWMRRYHAWQRG